MFMMTPQILNLLDSSKRQKAKHRKNKTLFSKNKKKIHLIYFKDYNMAKKSFLTEVNFKECKL